MKTRTYKLKIMLLTPMLGSQPDKNVASNFLAKKAGYVNGLPEDEVESLPDALEKGTTVFYRDDKDQPVLFDYQVKGFLKNAGQVHNGKNEAGLKALKKKINDLVFVSPRLIPIHVEGEMEMLERPLRAETAMGPRVALARSEKIDEGSWIQCGLTVLGDELRVELLRELLDYGYFMGLGQWRNGGWGQFRYELNEEP